MTDPSTERRSPMARWGQIARDLLRRIEQRELAPGEQLPSENELAEHYKVSRITVRQALSSLSADGYIHRRQGSGTFVSDTPLVVQHDLAIAEPWRERLTGFGVQAVSVDLPTTRTAPPPRALLTDLDLAPGSMSNRYFKRLQVVDGQPIGVSESWLAPGIAPGIEDDELLDGSLSVTLARAGVVASHVQSFLHAEAATGQLVEDLRCHQDTPIIVVNELSTLEDGTVIGCSRTMWLGQRVRFHHEQVRVVAQA